MSDSIQVAIKVRPLIKREINENLQVQWTVQGNVIAPNDPDLRKRGEGSLQFDHIFDSDRKNTDVFEVVVKPIVDAAIKGFNGTVFAYGQTSSGKTHTMMGTHSEPGIIPLAVDHMFDAISNTFGREFLLRVSYMEIYNERVNDLLDTNSTDLKLREDTNGLVQVLNCKEEVTSSPEGILNIMKKGDKNRRTGETDMNDRSSRSHTIFRITIESRETNSDSDGAIQVSQLNLVDLAGSERARQTGATGERFKEGTHINMSLSTLGLVIKQLSESSDSQKYINFRDSKLTRLLQASLGGNAMTTIICAITPAALEETQCTLWFASRAKSVKNKPQLNEVMSDAALLKRYKKQLDKLNAELEKIKVINRTDEVQEMESKLQEKESRLQEKEKLNQLLEERIQLLKSGIVSGDHMIKENSVQKCKARRRRTWAGGPERNLSPRFHPTINCLPTIKESTSGFSESNPNSPEKPAFCETFKERAKRRQSIIQTVDLANQTFETELADFEIELIQNEKERVAEWDEIADHKAFILQRRPREGNTVKFNDEVAVFQLSENDQTTPEKKTYPSSDKSPGTPKSELRKQLSYVTDEYTSLMEYTTLERQLIATDNDDKLHMINKINDLTKQVEYYSTCQNKFQEHNTKLQNRLTIATSCIHALARRFSDIPNEFKEPLRNGEIICDDLELNKLLDLLINKNNDNEKPEYLTSLEKELSNKYNECLRDLQETRLEKERLKFENEKMEAECSAKTSKLKDAHGQIENLKSDTDCLMTKLLQKGSELSKLKEKLVQLEKLNEELTQTVKPDNSIESHSEVGKVMEVIEKHSVTVTEVRVVDNQSYHHVESQTENHTTSNSNDFMQVSQKLNTLEIENADMKSLIDKYKLILSKDTEDRNSQQSFNDYNDKIAALKKENETLTENLSKTQAQIQIYEELPSLKTSVEMTSSVDPNLTIEQLTRDLELKVKETQMLQNTVDCLNQKVLDLDNELDLRKKEASDLRKIQESEKQDLEKAELISQKETLTQILNNKVKELEEMSVIKCDLENQIASFDLESKHMMTKELNSKNQLITEITQQNSLLETDIIDSKHKLSLLESENIKLKDHISSLEIRLKELQDKVSEEPEKHELEKSEWESKNQSTSQQIDSKLKEIDGLDAAKSVLEKNNYDSNIKEEKLTDYIDEEISSLRTSPDIENTKKEQQENHSDVVERLRLTLQRELEESKSKMSELEECNTNLKNKSAEMEKLLKFYEEEISGLKLVHDKEKEVIVSNQEIVKFETQNKKLTDYSSKLENQIKILEEEVTTLKNMHESAQLSQSDEHVEEVNSKAKELIELKATKTHLENHIQEYTRQISELTSHCQKMTEEISKMEYQLTIYKEKISVLQTLNETEKQAFDNDLNLKVQELEKITAKKLDLERCVDESQRKVIELESECKKRKDNEKTLENKLKHLQEEISIHQQNREVIEKMQLKDESFTEGNNSCSNNSVNDQNLSSNILTSPQEDKTTSDQEFLVQELHAKIETLTLKNGNLESHIEITNVKILELEDEKQQMLSHLSDMEVQLNTFEEVISALTESVELAKENLESEEIKSQIKVLSHEAFVKSQDIQKLNLLKEVLENYIDDSRNLIMELRKQNENLKDEIIVVDDQIQSFENQLLSLREGIDDLDADTKDLDSTIELLVPTIETEPLDHKENLIESMENQIREHKKKIASLRQLRNEESQMIVALELKIAELSKTENETNDDAKEYENQIKEVLLNSVQNENVELKQKLEELENKSSNLRAQVTEYEALVHKLEEDKRILSANAERCLVKNLDAIDSVPDSVKIEEKLILQKINKSEFESSSIFANNSYFDQMQNYSKTSTSYINEDSFNSNILNNSQNSTLNKDMSSCSEKFFDTSDGGIANVTMKLNDSQTSENQDVSKTPESFVNGDPDSSRIHDLVNERLALSEANEKLNCTLRLKIQEAEDIQNDLHSLKQGIENLQQTVLLLTNENMETSKQLTQERERYNQLVASSQNEIDEMRARLSQVTEEKVIIENEIARLKEQLDNLRSVSPVGTDDEMKDKILEYQRKIQVLTEENIGLSSDLMEKIEELDKVKESRVQLYDHECAYKEKNESLLNKMQYIEKENIDLSNNLTEQIEECDNLKESLEVLERKLEIYTTRKESSDNSDLEHLRRENDRLTDECIELQAKLEQLTAENANLSLSIILDSPDRTPRNDDSSTTITGSYSIGSSATLVDGSIPSETLEDEPTATKKELLEQIEHLTLLNKKLSDLKLSSCSQCAHLKELNESRRALKLEVKSLSGKLGQLKKQFERKCQDVDALRTKASEDFNTSLSMLDTTLNTSLLDGANVSFMEDKVHYLQNEFEELKGNHDKLSSLYKEKCSELEKLQSENPSGDKSCLSNLDQENDSNKAKAPEETSKRLQNLHEIIEKFSIDLQDLKKSNSETSAELEKIRPITKQEIVLLKSENEKLKKNAQESNVLAVTLNEKLRLCEEEMSMLYKDIEKAKITEKELCTKTLNVEVQLETLIGEKLDLVARNEELITKHKEELESVKAGLKKFTEENTDLQKAVKKLQDQLQSAESNMEKGAERKMCQALQEELDSTKSRIIKEVKSLKPSITHKEYSELSNKSVSDTFAAFLNVIMKKEGEIMKQLQEEFERQKRKLQDEKEQYCDDEKRIRKWANTLEADLEKSQIDLIEQEAKNKKLQEVMSKLEKIVQDASQENQQLRDKIAALEADINLLHEELENKSKANLHQDTAISVAQEQQRLARSKEAELEHRILLEKEKYVHKINELSSLLDSYKSKNLDLLNTVEGLEINEKHMKNTINLKASEIVAANRKIQELQKELEQLEESCRQLNAESSSKSERIEEITGLLKNKCDLLSEYKTKVETMKPEYEILKEQAEERKNSIERFKSELEVLRNEHEKRVNALTDKLSAEEINAAGLSKQLAEMMNKHTVQSDQMEEMRERIKELERDNERLQRKVRNSTSKVRVEMEMEDLHDQNRTLKNNLDGAYNRITELQDSKAQVLRELIDLRGKYDLAAQELASNQKLITNLREKVDNSVYVETSEKYESLLQEKNATKLELEEKKLLLLDREKKMNELGDEVEALQKKNKELDDEMDDMVKVIHKQEEENAKLETKIFKLEDEMEKLKVISADSPQPVEYVELLESKNNLLAELNGCHREIESLREKNKELDEEMDEMVKHIHKQENEIETLRDELITGGSVDGAAEKLKVRDAEIASLKKDLITSEHKRARCDDEVVRLTAEKQILLVRVDELDNKLNEMESRTSSKGSSRCASPALQDASAKNRRRQRRSDLFNEKRQLEPAHEESEILDTSITARQDDCLKCTELREKIRELSLELVSRNNKITMLEVQIQTENFPYQAKCKDLQESLLTYRKKNSELKIEIINLQRALNEDSARDCPICRHWKCNKNDKSVQCTPENKIYMSGRTSGIVEEEIRIQKIEKEKSLMKDVCRARARKIRELEERIKELESATINDQSAVK